MKLPTHWSHLIAADMPVDENWTFAQALSRETGLHFDVISADGRAHVPRWRRIIVYVGMALRLMCHRRHIKVLVSWQQFFGLIFASLCHLLHVRKHTRIVVMTFIYRPKQGIVGRIYSWWMRHTLNSGFIDKVLVYSRHEVEHYARQLDVPTSLFRFVPLGIESETVENSDDRGYWFSTGKSNRDYDFLINALAGTTHRLVIACDTLPQPKATNVTVHHHAFGRDMLQLMNAAHGVIIALDDEHVSSGQLVMLQALMLGKPLIITRSCAVTDYVDDGTTALIIDKTPAALLAAIDRLSDKEFSQRIGSAAKQHFHDHHTIAALAHSVASLLAN
ncbi:MAG: glycosyltransferase family 4 protein [Muribaculaceae bacterium]|nr:glycosyltransferase family 4 protein [Muribaculaceae bacterium]